MKKSFKNSITLLFICTLLTYCSDSSDEDATNNNMNKPDPSDVGNQVPQSGFDAPESYSGYTLTWSDEFNGTRLNLEDWNFEIGNIDPFGNVGWGNNELQQYRSGNVSVSDGYLTIELREESNGDYTSGRINTRDKQEYRYGRIDVRAALPNQKGMWPAIWMLGENHLESGWPVCGEIDIMEAFISGPATANQIKSNAFWGNTFPAPNAPSPPYVLRTGDFSDEWHVFSLEWDENTLEFFVDGNKHYELIINEELGAHFRNEFFFIMNIAVGGNPVPDPDSSTILPQRMFIDYIRVYQKS